MLKEKYALVISPHCDDAVICLGSYLYNCFKHVRVLNIFNKSRASILDLAEDKITEIRVEEDRHISDKYGFTFENADFSDTSIRNVNWRNKQHNIEALLLEEITDWLSDRLIFLFPADKTVVFIPSSYELHPDHYLCLLACCNNKVAKTLSVFNQCFLYCDQPYYYEHNLRPQPLLKRIEERFVLFKHEFDKEFKADMLRHYKSQLSPERINLLTETIRYEYFKQISEVGLIREWASELKNVQ